MKRTLLMLFLVFGCVAAKATHLYCGYISIKHLGNRECEITLTIYTNTGSEIRFGDGILDFGDGSPVHTPPTVENTLRPDLGPNIGIVRYTTTHTYPEFGSYFVSYLEPNRMAGIINLFNSVETKFYIESYFTITSNFDPYRSPDFLADPIFWSGTESPFTLSLAGVDSTGSQLLYWLTSPKMVEATAYRLPESSSVNVYTGLFSWDGIFEHLSRPGDYLFTELVAQYRDGILIGSVTRDIAVIVENFTTAPWIDSKDPNDRGRIMIAPSSKDSVKIVFHEPNGTQAPQMEVFSELSSVNGVLAYSVKDSSYVDVLSQPVKATVLKLEINSLPSIDREDPYLITVRGKIGKQGQDYAVLLHTRPIQDPVITGLALPKSEKGRDPYPNPTYGILNFSTPATATVYSSQGVALPDCPAGSTSIDISHLPSGVYVLRGIRENGSHMTFRFLKR